MGFNLGGLLKGIGGALPVVGTAIGIGEGILGMAGGNSQSNQANAINPQWTNYTANPYAAKRLGLANNLFNGRMAGAANLERNIAATGQNQIANINRNATDSSQALALASGVQGQMDNAYEGLQTKEQQNKYSLLDNLNSAYNGMINEDDKVYQSQRDKYDIDMKRKDAFGQAGAQNFMNGLDRIGSTAVQAGQLFGGANTTSGIMKGLGKWRLNGRSFMG